MRKIPELLSPAGGSRQLIAAVENGADSVYIGGRLFNARQNADNFTDEEMKDAVRYAHVRGVNIYVTCNTLVSDKEMTDALKYAASAYESGADALIIQDIGLAGMIKKTMPEIPLHLSTQGSVYNIEGVRIAAELGFSRVVLARELHEEEIRHIADQAPIETEVFVHGALCVSYSGQCLMSNAIGGRSGNRGLCAQPCRLPYELFAKDPSKREKKIGGKGYLLSPADLCLLPCLTEVIKTGVSCLKIEGRMKSPEYVAVTTGIYRKYLDRYAKERDSHTEKMIPEKEDMQALLQIFNRGGFTTGYFKGNNGRQMIAGKRSKHEGVYLGKVVKCHEGKKLIDIKLADKLYIGDGIEIMAEGLPGNIVTSLKKAGQRQDAAYAGDVVQVGYIQGKAAIGSKVYKISDKQQMKEAYASFAYRQERKKAVEMSLYAKKGRPLELFISLPDSYLDNKCQKQHNIYITSDCICEQALAKPLTKKRIQEQLSKTGNTPFRVARCEVDMDDDISVPLSEINGLRRQGLEGLAEKLQKRYPDRQTEQEVAKAIQEQIKSGAFNEKKSSADKTEQESIVHKAKQKNNRISLYFFQWDGGYECPDFQVHRVYIPYWCFLDTKYIKPLRQYKEKNIEVVAAFPAVTKGYHDRIIKDRLHDLIKHPCISGFMIGNIGHLLFCRGSGLSVYADTSMNVYNSYTAGVLSRLGVSGVSLSCEITQIPAGMKNGGIQCEILTHGPLPVMYSECCPVSCRNNGTGHKQKEPDQRGNEYYILDRAGEKWSFITDCLSCRAVIFSPAGRGPGRQKTGVSKENAHIDSQGIRINILKDCLKTLS